MARLFNPKSVTVFILALFTILTQRQLFAAEGARILVGVIQTHASYRSRVVCKNRGAKSLALRVRYILPTGETLGKKKFQLLSHEHKRLPFKRRMKGSDHSSILYEIRTQREVSCATLYSPLHSSALSNAQSGESMIPLKVPAKIISESPLSPGPEELPFHEQQENQVNCQLADLNADRVVSILDYLIALERYLTGEELPDIDSNGIRDQRDLNALYGCFGTQLTPGTPSITCSDSDEGVDPFTQGTVRVREESSDSSRISEIATDFCVGNSIYEFSFGPACVGQEGAHIRGEQIDCAALGRFRCDSERGACVPLESPSNAPPQVSAGGDLEVTLPEGSVYLFGSVTDDGFPSGTVRITWSLVDGPEQITFSNSHSPITRANFISPGTYILQLSASDGEATSSDTVSISVRTRTEEFPVLVPGDGFTDDNSIGVDPRGESSGSTASKAIARWDVVPWRDITELSYIGVLAFHAEGIERVDFSLEGGAWTSVYEPRLNPDTQVEEYTAAIDPTLLEDGAIEIQAIVWPQQGSPRILAGAINENTISTGEHSMELFSNGSGSLPTAEIWISPTGSDDTGNGTSALPFATVKRALYASTARGRNVGSSVEADGTTVFLAEGDYGWSNGVEYSTAYSRWVTITAAPGANPDLVRISSRGVDDHGLRISRIRLLNLTIMQDGENTRASVTGTGANRALWIDHSVMQGSSRRSEFVGGFQYRFITSTSKIFGRNAFRSYHLVRNCTALHIGEDGVSDSKLVVNTSVHDISPFDSQVHPDGAAYWPSENVILFNVSATGLASSQGLFFGDMQDMAIVNSLFDNQTDVPPQVGLVFHLLGQQTRNVYFLNSTFIGGSNFRVDRGFAADPLMPVVLDNTFFSTASGRPAPSYDIPGVEYRNEPASHP
ncbi:MAG: PKD domain-containing protein [Bdellovibrionales bacterium]|nr:PKD domain-containing protein [Bdellovibrionales bacterium]